MGQKMSTLKGFRSVYCDASFFVALFSKKDAEHRRALELFNEIKEEKISICTSWFVISEAITLLLYRYGYTEARVFGESIHLYHAVHPRETQYYQALALFNLYGKDRSISFVDALSHVLVTGVLNNIPAISFDEHFRSLGITTIS
jgi:predicted nucleic acid-binding protein